MSQIDRDEPFRLHRKSAVTAVRKIDGREEEILIPTGRSADDSLDEFLSGLSQNDLRGRLSGFGSNIKRASPGAGDFETKPERSGAYQVGPGQPIDILEQTYGPEGVGGDDDILLQPESPTGESGHSFQHKEEGDFVDRPSMRNYRQDRPTEDDQEALWDMSNEEIFDEYTDQRDEGPKREPAFERREWPKTEYRSRRTSSVEEDLMKALMTDESATFKSRRL